MTPKPMASPPVFAKVPTKGPSSSKQPERIAASAQQLEELQNTEEGRKTVAAWGPGVKVIDERLSYESMLMSLATVRPCCGVDCRKKGRVICTCNDTFCEDCWTKHQKQCNSEGRPRHKTEKEPQEQKRRAVALEEAARQLAAQQKQIVYTHCHKCMANCVFADEVNKQGYCKKGCKMQGEMRVPPDKIEEQLEPSPASGSPPTTGITTPLKCRGCGQVTGEF